MVNGDSNFPLNLISSFNNSNDIEQRILIIEWCYKRKFDYIKLIIIDTVNKCRDFKFLKSGKFKSPLMICAKKGYIEVFELISQFPTIDWGINYCCSSGNSALHYAILNSQTKFVEKLLIFGADVNLINKLNQNALQVACSRGQDNLLIIQNLIEFYKTSDCLKLNRLDNRNKAALHYRCQYAFGYEVLLKNGADPNVLDAKNRTPLYYAALGNYITVIKCLLSYGCDPNRKSTRNNTVLRHAVENGQIDTVVILIKYRADLDLVYNRKETIIHFAISWRRRDMIKLLLKANCSVNRVFTDSPLKLSLILKSYYVAACLILCGCDLGPVWTLFRDRIERLLSSIGNQENIYLPFNSMEDMVDNSDDSDYYVSNLNKTNKDLLDWIIKQAIQPQCLKLICRTKIRTIFRESCVHEWRPHMSSDDLNSTRLFNDIEPKLPDYIVDYLNCSFLDYQNPLQMIWD